MKATAIPELARTLVAQRDRWRCQMCAVPTPAGHWHHRRSRSVRSSHTHCACNGVWLCPVCHQWVHQNPAKARAMGFIVSRYEVEPWTVPYNTPTGWRLPDCNGGWQEHH